MSERPSAAASIAKGLHRVKARGPGETSALLARRVKEAIWSDDELIVWSRPTGASEGPPAAGGVRRAGPADADAYARDIGTDSAKTFRSRLSPVSWCYLLEEEGRLIHSSWVTTHRAWTRELRTYVSPPAGAAYVYESFTRPEVRGRGVYPAALSGMASAVAGDADVLWVMVEADNPASIRSVSKAGFTQDGMFVVHRRWGRLSVEALSDPGLLLGDSGGAGKQTNP